MKKKGFTLIELLAVIVILAIIALIAVPTILRVIEKSKVESAKSSALGYINAVEQSISINLLKDETIKKGIYKVSEINNIKYKGKGPSEGIIEIEEKRVKNAKLCIDNLSINYDGKNVEISTNNYCSNDFKVELVIGDNIKSKNIGKEIKTTFEISDISNMTNVSCNNGAVPTIEENVLKVTNIFGNTKCEINETLEKTISSLDDTENNIVMLNNENIDNTIKIKNSNILNLDLNSFVINFPNSSGIDNYGSLLIYDLKGAGKIVSKYQSLINSGKKNIIINSGNYERIDVSGSVIYNSSTGKILINNGNFKCSNVCIQNNYKDTNDSGYIIINNGYFESTGMTIYNVNDGQITINGGTYISKNDSPPIVNNAGGKINITDLVSKVYIANLNENTSSVYYPKAIINISSGNIDIKGDKADICNNSAGINNKGICIYSNYRSVLNEVNATGKININGATIISDSGRTINNFIGTINITNSEIYSNWQAIQNSESGIVNVCNSVIDGQIYDLVNEDAGYIYYNSMVSLKNNTINDTNELSHIILDNSITCK